MHRSPLPFLVRGLLRPLARAARRRTSHTVAVTVALAVAGPLLLLGATAAAADQPLPSSGAWPLRPRPDVVAAFAPPSSPWGAGHRGVDLGGHAAQPVRSALAGTVVFAGRLAGRGVVVVDHGSTRTTYEPLSAAVQVGDRVAAGEVIGTLQLFGSHCFPRWCLHWGLIEGHDHYLDPLTLVGAAPVRLLPLHGGLPALSISPLRWSRPAPRATAALGRSLGLAPPAALGPLSDGTQARGWAWR